jgi:hypothetical protein
MLEQCNECGQERFTEEATLEIASTGRCGEAQADGVPCPTPGKFCDTCGRALPARDPLSAPANLSR